MVPKMYCTCYLSVSLDISNVSDIPPITEIPIIQISSRLWIQKGMTLDVCPEVPKILNIVDIPDIPTIPEKRGSQGSPGD